MGQGPGMEGRMAWEGEEGKMLVNRRSIKLAYSMFVIWKQAFLLSAGSRKPFNLLMCNCAPCWD